MKYTLGTKDFINGLKTALFVSLFTGFYTVTLQPNFSVATTDWEQVFTNMIDISLVTTLGYISRKFFENSKGELLRGE